MSKIANFYMSGDLNNSFLLLVKFMI